MSRRYRTAARASAASAGLLLAAAALLALPVGGPGSTPSAAAPPVPSSPSPAAPAIPCAAPGEPVIMISYPPELADPRCPDTPPPRPAEPQRFAAERPGSAPVTYAAPAERRGSVTLLPEVAPAPAPGGAVRTVQPAPVTVTVAPGPTATPAPPRQQGLVPAVTEQLRPLVSTDGVTVLPGR